MVRLLCNLQEKGLHTKNVLQDFSGFISLVTRPRSVLPTKKKKHLFCVPSYSSGSRAIGLVTTAHANILQDFGGFISLVIRPRSVLPPQKASILYPQLYTRRATVQAITPLLGLNFLLNLPRMNPQLQEWLNYANNHFDIMDQQMCIEHLYTGYSLMISNNYHTSFATVAYMTQWDN